jgi:hypothetical protein
MVISTTMNVKPSTDRVSFEDAANHKENFDIFKSLPLLRDLFADPSVGICQRSCSPQWWYSQRGWFNLRGFNPGLNQVMVVQGSAFDKWLSVGRLDKLRNFNTYDFLVEELFSTMHDYLHIWAYQLIQNEFPEYGFGQERITSKNIDDFIYLHLVTEVVAALGTDYWLLSQKNADDILQCGTVLTTSATRYHKSQDKEFHRIGIFPGEKEFFDDFLDIVCLGVIKKAKLQDFKMSASFSLWAKHVLGYAVNQRQYTSTWLRLQSLNLNPYTTVDQIKWRSGKRKKIAQTLKEALIEKLKGHRLYQKPVSWTWDYNMDHGLDFRFFNLNYLRQQMNPQEWMRYLKRTPIVGDSRYLLAQMVVSLKDPGKERKYVSEIEMENVSTFNPKMLLPFSKEKNWLPITTQEPKAIFFAN